MSDVADLRALLADSALRAGPDAPTLCHPWSVRDLLAHLVLRQSRPDAMPGIGVPVAALQRRTEAVQEEIAAGDFVDLLRQVRQGPPVWSPMRVGRVAQLVDLPEFAIHLEDIARAQQPPAPTVHPPERAAALWAAVRRVAPIAYRSGPVGVVLVAEGHGRVSARRPRSGGGTVVLRGTPLELLLHAFGRTAVADVALEGAEQDVQALAAHTRAF